MIENTLNNECPIATEGCCVEFGNELVLDDLTFSVTEGSLVAVVGPNGGGKTTLFNVISGLIPVTHGSIKIKGLSPQESGETRQACFLETTCFQFHLKY